MKVAYVYHRLAAENQGDESRAALVLRHLAAAQLGDIEVIELREFRSSSAAGQALGDASPVAMAPWYQDAATFAAALAEFNARVSTKHYDVLVTPDVALAAALPSSAAVVYFAHEEPAAETSLDDQQVERCALDCAVVTVVASETAASAVLARHRLDAKKLGVFPWEATASSAVAEKLKDLIISRLTGAKAAPKPPPLRVAFLANRFIDPRHPNSWSGLPYFTKRALENAGVEIEVIWCGENPGIGCWTRFLWHKFVRGKRYLRYVDRSFLKGCARNLERQLKKAREIDAVFSLTTWLTAYLKTDLPVALYTDASFAGLLGFYQSFTDLAPRSVQEGHEVEQQALTHCTRMIYATHWASETAQRSYQIDPKKVDVVYFGANFSEAPDPAQVRDSIARRDLAECKLLLVGVDWYRKGVDIAIAAAQSLHRRGVNVSLTIVGCSAPSGVELPAFVTVIPYVSKKTLEGRQQLAALYEQSHFFILPSRAEASGIVFSEASAYGVPSLAPDVGGISSVVVNGVNGRLFPASAAGADYADYIATAMTDLDGYRDLALRTQREAETRLNWEVAGANLARILRDAVTAQRQALAASASSTSVRTAKRADAARDVTVVRTATALPWENSTP